MSELTMRVLDSGWGLPVLVVLKATMVLVLAAGLTAMLSRRAAAWRHLVWTLAMVTLLVLPLATLAIPAWRLPVLTPAVVPGALPGEAAVTTAAGVDGRGGAGEPAVAPGIGAVPGSEAGAGVPGLMARVGSPGGVVLLWLSGAGLVLVWLVSGQLLLRRVLGRANPLSGPGWEGARRDASWLLEVRRPVRLYRSPSVSVPVTWGVLRPVVVLPEEAESWPDAQRRMVLLHELSHVARLDGLTQLVAGLASAVYWFHPAVWYGARRMRVEREHACDELVLSAGAPAPEYAAALLELARRFRRTVPAPLLALPMARPSQLEGRLLRVLAGPSGSGTPGRPAVVAAAGAVLAITMPLAAIQPGPGSAAAGASAVAVEDAREPAAAADGVPALAREGAPERSADRPARVPADTPVPRAATTRSGTVRISDSPDSVARLVPRVPLTAASFAITTLDGHTALLLRDTTIVLQLTDQGLEEIGRSTADEEQDFLKALLGSMLRGGLRMLLDRGLEYSLADLREARYERGRLVLESRRGNEIFENVEIEGRQLMESFSERDARAFARRVNAARARLP
jgi:hypothetical protein